MLRYTVLALLSLTVAVEAEQRENFFTIEENCFSVDGNAIWNGKADSMMSCSLMCARRDDCKSANFLENQRTCSLLGTQTTNPEKLSKQKGSFYLEKHQVDLSGSFNLPGTTQSSPVSSCQALLSQSPSPPSGVYWIDPDGGAQDNAFEAYCDMATDGGGWTLVWSYTFTDYDHFTRDSNAVSPRPDWPVEPAGVYVPLSSTTPLGETDYNAMNFSQWKQIGREILIKSNINNWLSCLPGSGSLVDLLPGAISCRIVNNVTRTCLDPSLAPSVLSAYSSGPVFSTALNSPGDYYFFDVSTEFLFPTHDPCGTNKENNLEHVANPHGNIFVR